MDRGRISVKGMRPYFLSRGLFTLDLRVREVAKRSLAGASGRTALGAATLAMWRLTDGWSR